MFGVYCAYLNENERKLIFVNILSLFMCIILFIITFYAKKGVIARGFTIFKVALLIFFKDKDVFFFENF